MPLLYRTLVLCLFFFTSFNLNAQVTSNFNVNNDSWTVFDSNAGSSSGATYSAAGGNPSGNISFTTSSGSVNFFWTAPAKFNGNLSSGYNQNLSFDMIQSTAGVDNSNYDVTLVGPGITLVYQLPSKPGTTWTSYSVLLNESQWHDGCSACALTTKDRMKQVLANITKFQIRLKYLSGNTAPYTAQLDNVVLNTLAVGTPPTITSFSPTSALAGATVTITGTNFNSTAAQNIVYFKGVKATVTNATATQLKVTVPTSSAFGALTIVNLSTGLQGVSTQSFNPLFDNNKDFGGRIIPASMGRGYNAILPMNSLASNSFGGMDKGDLDGDGWIDLVTTETSTKKIYAFPNLGTGGAVSASSFGSAISLSLATIPGGSPYLSEVLVVDVDSDGKLDIAASTANNSTGYLAVFQNTSSVGSISFAPPVFFSYNYYSSLYMAAGDLDGDGRTDFAFTTGTSPGNIFLSQNLSTPGNIDFAFGVSLSAASTSGLSDIVIGDLTGDGKPEIVCPGYNATTLSIYQNNSTPGLISMGAAFTIPALVSYTVQLAMADLDADNKLDMVWSVYGAQYVYFAKNNYSGGTFDASSFGTTIQVANKLSNPLGITVGDINADNKPDVIMSGYNDLAILQNVGTTGNLSSTSFLPTTLFSGSGSAASIFGLSPVVADVDGDNKPEAIFVTSGGGLPAGATGIYIFHNESYPVPSITSVSPTSGIFGTTVSLNGDLMFTGSNSPTVRLNKTLSTITGSPTNTKTSILNPTSGISGKFSLTNHGLTVMSSYFKKTFVTDKTITGSSFGPSINFALAFGARDVLDIADFDDDGKMDVVISDNNGVGIFQNSNSVGQSITPSSLTLLSTTYSPGANAVAYDIDGDSKVDLNSGSGIYQNTSTASISFASNVFTSASNPSGIATTDFNKDGKVDLAMTNGSSNILVFENQSSRGTFMSNGNLSTYYPTSTNLPHPTSKAFGAGNQCIVAVDFDGDGYDDLAATSSSDNSFTFFRNLAVFGNISGSSFSVGTSVATASQPYGITANDFDGDGKIDVGIVHYNSTAIHVYLNTSTAGSLSFAAPINLTGGQTFGYNISSQDLDGDGKPEIVTTRNPNPGTPSFSVFQNNSTAGNLNFAAAITYTLTRYPQAIAFADINSDQKPDILIVASGGSAPANALMVFENKIASPVISITTQPNPVYSVCDGATPTISTAATGTTNITYQWQISPDGIAPFTDLTNTGGYSNVSTASFTINSTGNFGGGIYRCKINGDLTATVYTNTVSFTVNALPTAPTASNASNCGPGSVVITASGGSNGQYLWYDQNGVISGQTNNTYSTPVLAATTPYSVALTNGICVSTKTNVNAIILTSGCATITINSQPADFNACVGDMATFTTSASGTTNITYQWQFSSTGSGGPYADVVNGNGYSNANTATLSVNTAGNFGAGRYRCKIDGDFATTAYTNDEGLFINAIPAAPTVQGASGCANTQIILTASGGTNGQYRWYAVASGGPAINGEVNSTYTTPTLTTSTTFYVSINNGNCESARTPVAATINNCNPPVIESKPLATQLGGKVMLDLKPLISTANLDLTSLQIITPPSSGATASIDANGILTIDYAGKAFVGDEQITIKACDQNGKCSTQDFTINVEVPNDIVVYNGISPNGANPKLVIQYIDILPDSKSNTVYIFDRWENLVWQGSNYDNSSVVFTGIGSSGGELPSGVYFYKIDFASGKKTKTGFISLRRQ